MLFSLLNLQHTQQVNSNFQTLGMETVGSGTGISSNCFSIMLQVHPKLSTQQRLYLKTDPFCVVWPSTHLRKAHGYGSRKSQNQINSNNLPWKAIKKRINSQLFTSSNKSSMLCYKRRRKLISNVCSCTSQKGANLYMHILFSISDFVPLFFPPPTVRSLSPL